MKSLNLKLGKLLTSMQVVWIYFFSITLFVIFNLIRDFQKGGNSWKQGDWLINSMEVEIRRGWLGSIILNLSDYMHFSPLLIAILLQGGLFIVLSIAIYRVIQKEGAESPITWLMLSPFFVLIFWGNDPQGSMRKELFSYAAIALLILSRISFSKYSNLLVALAISVFVLGAFSHEINLMLAPSFIFVLYCVIERNKFSVFVSWSVPLVIGCLLAAIYSVTHAAVPNTEAVCAPLLERGLADGICDGAIKWLRYTPSDGYQSVLRRWEKGGGWLFVLFYAACILLVARFRTKFSQAKSVWVLFFGLLIPILPLYFVAIDYGRWMSTHFTIFTLCIVAMKYRGLITQVAQVSRRELVIMLLIAPALSPHHVLGKSDSRVILAIVIGLFSYLIVANLIDKRGVNSKL